MVISNISLKKDEQFVTLSADIAFRNKATQQAYFMVLRNYETFVIDDATPFLAAFLVPCMKTRENIYIDDTVSALVLENTNEIMSLLKRSNNDLYKIKIRTKRTSKNVSNSSYIGSFFEADVDTFYTYLKENSKKTPITYFIYAHGLHDYLQSKDYSLEKEIVINKIAKDQKMNAIFIETNIGSLIDERLHWNFVYPGSVESAALFLNRDFKKIFIPETNKNRSITFDALWSTEAMTVQHGKSTHTYSEKIKQIISKSSLALKYLHVCSQNTKNGRNCGHCYNCLATMIFLYTSNTLKKAKTFEKKIDIDHVKKMHINYSKKENILIEKALEILKRSHIDNELQKAILYSLEKNKRPGVLKNAYLHVKSINLFTNKVKELEGKAKHISTFKTFKKSSLRALIK